MAYAASVDGKWRIVVDGQPQDAFGRVGAPTFSPDGRRLAYAAQLADGRRTVVVDGKQGKPCDRILEGGVHFSPDGKHVAYGAQFGEKWRVVFDGQEGEAYDYLGVSSGIRFSPDSRRFAYAALSEKKWAAGCRSKAAKGIRQRW